MSNALLSKYPIARIILPFAFGIILCENWNITSTIYPIALLIVGLILQIIIYWYAKSPNKRLTGRRLAYTPLFIIIFSIGWLNACLNSPKDISLRTINGKISQGTIDEIKFKDRSMEMTVHMFNSGQGRFWSRITTKGCNYSLKSGDIIAFYANFEDIKNNGNPDEVDYSSILKRKSILFGQHLDRKDIKVCGHESSINSIFSNYRQELQNKIFSSNLNADCQKFIIALILGNKSFIDADTRYEFSCAGVAHILALSGLHVGMLSLVIWWILIPLDYFQLRKLRFIITLLIVLLFAIFTGMSPSVVRSSIMIGMVYFSYILYKRPTPINSLLFAALLILIFAPQSIFDVGFQLSFISVGSLLLFLPKMKKGESRIPLWNYFKTLIYASIISLISTVALTAYYFHTITWLSVISNLLILPIFPVFMVLSAIYIFFSAIGIDWNVLDYCLNIIYQYIDWIVIHVSKSDITHSTGIYITGYDLTLYYLALIIAITGYFKKNLRIILISIGICGFMFVGHECFMSTVSRHGMVMFNSYDSTPIFYYQNNMGYLWEPDDENVDVNKFQRYHTGFMAHHQIDTIKIIQKDTIKIGNNLFKSPYAYINGEKIMIAAKGKWKHMTTTKPLLLDYCIITKHFHGEIDDLLRLFHIKHFVFSGNIYKTDLEKLKHDCDSLKVNYINLKNEALIKDF